MSASSLEADLRAAREAAAVSVEQIQQETRIPTDVIHRFEAGKLLNDPAFNEVYIKAFLRAYAGAVGLPPNHVVEAYAASRAGTYRGQLNPEAPPEAVAPPEPVASAPSSAEPPRVAPVEAEQAESEPVAQGPPAEPAPPASAERAPSDRAPAVAALSRAPEAAPAPRPQAGPNEHFPKRRVASAASVARPRSLDRSWGTIIGGTVVVVLVVAGVLWLLFRDDTPQPEEVTVAVADTTEVEGAALADTTEGAAPAQTSGPPLVFPISITVLAGGDGLQEFRAAELPADRRPYWVEPGDELTLESGEGVVLWGEGAQGLDPGEVTLRWQGFEWNPPEDQVLRITPQNGQRLLDSLQTAGAGRTP